MRPITPLLGIAAITSCILIGSPNVVAQSFLTNGLIAYYPFSGNANDASGNGNNGNPGTAQLATDRFGRPNAAYYFNGTNSFITFTGTPTTNVDNVSMFCWLKTSVLPQWGVAITLGYANGNLPCNGYGLGIGSGSTGQSSRLFGENACISWVDGGFTFPSTTTWHQVGFVRQSGYDYFYADGQVTGIQQVGTPSPPTDFCIGTLLGSDQLDAVFNGFIDDVRIYNRALGTNEIQQLYSFESSNPPCPAHAATATAQIVNGFLVGATIIDAGCGYTNPPTVEVIGGGGSGATAVAIVNNGIVTGITVTTAGSGYTNKPAILIASPPFAPWLSIAVSAVTVTEHVVLGRNYVLESSTDNQNWTQVGAEFTAQAEVIMEQFPTDATGRFFRIRELP